MLIFNEIRTFIGYTTNFFKSKNLISIWFNSPRLASFFRGKFENGWFSSTQKIYSSKCLVGLPRGLFTLEKVLNPEISEGLEKAAFLNMFYYQNHLRTN